MTKLLLFSLCVLLALVFALPGLPAEKVTCYTIWDDLFFYAAFQVQDQDVQSTNRTHMSNPWEDDCVEVFLETDNQKAPNRSPATYQMSVSAGGGSSFVVGENGQPVPKTIYTFKFAKTIQGTLNRPQDRDIGFFVELAMPWSEMGGPPTSGKIMGFNVLCRMRGENSGFVSFSPLVKTEEDVHIPALWGSIKFMDNPTIIAMENGAVVCRKAVRRPPLIDGRLSPGEWITDMRFQLTKPEPSAPPAQPFIIEKLAMTHYFYWYQGNERKEIPPGHVRYEDGSSALTSHPLSGTGPWFSCDSVGWHKEQLREITNAGIEVILPIYWGNAKSKQSFASKGLSCMVQALKELKAESETRVGYPMVSMFFDTSSMWAEYGEKPNLQLDEVKETFYGMIQDFFLHVPDEFRARVQLPAEKGSQPAYIIVLYTASWFSDLDSSFVEYCSKRFAEDFGGRLIWIGASDFREKAGVMDGYCDYGAGLGVKLDSSGWIRMAAVGAGYDDSAVPGRTTPIRSRMEGNTYKKDWETVVTNTPDWVILDGWNELHEGSDLCPSMEYGARYTDLTKINILRFNGFRAYDAKFLKHNSPQTMLPGMLYQITLTIKNAGTKPWPKGSGISLAGRWFKEGMLIADTGLRLPLQEEVPAGHTIEKTTGIRIVDQEGKPLQHGSYELRLELVGASDSWFSEGGDIPLCIPVIIEKPAPGFTLVSSTMPTMVKTGAEYHVKVRLRNDGPSAWKSGARVTCKWYKVSVHIASSSEAKTEELAVAPAEAILTQDVAPGRIVEVTIPIKVSMVDGTPIPLWKPNDLWTYVIKWNLVDEEHSFAQPGIGCASEVVKVLDCDYGPKFVSHDTPQEMIAGKKYKVSLTIENNGVETWTKGEYSVGSHWYYLDGIEAQWDASRTILPSDVPPGSRVVVEAWVTAPLYDGQYSLVWDLVHGDRFISTTGKVNGESTINCRVSIVKGKLLPIDLVKLFDADVSSFDTNRADGDADGTGLTLPAEFLPPLVVPGQADATLWPCGLWAPIQGSRMDSSRRISFAYTSKLDGAKNAVTCTGQTVNLKPGRYTAVHILALSTAESKGVFTLTYGTEKSTSEVEFSPWDAPPKHGEHPAFVCLHRHSPDGDQRGQFCYINHYELKPNSTADLTAIVLPNLPSVKILALTLEKAG